MVGIRFGPVDGWIRKVVEKVLKDEREKKSDSRREGGGERRYSSRDGNRDGSRRRGREGSRECQLRGVFDDTVREMCG
jgi:hypothetical protein